MREVLRANNRYQVLLIKALRRYISGAVALGGLGAAVLFLSTHAHAAPRALASEVSLLETGSHCVAYRVKKTTLFMKNDDVVGKNCDVSAQVLPEVGGLYHIEVNIPIRSFESGDSERDRDVMKILKAEERPELTFKSASRTANQWRDLFAKKDFVLEGELSIGPKSFPVKMGSRYSEHEENAEIEGSTKVKFEDFGLHPPKVAGGIVASVKQDLELHYHFVSARVLGADSIRLKVENN